MSEDSTQFCPVNAALCLLNERWTLHIIRSLMEGKRRFNELSKENGINPRTLSDRLKELEEQGVVERRVIQTMPPHVEYELSEKGRGLICIMESLAAWGRTWMKPPRDVEGEALPSQGCPEGS